MATKTSRNAAPMAQVDNQTVQQIYNIVNTAAAQALGTAALTATNTSSFVSLGEAVLSSNNLDSFFHKLNDTIGRTTVAIREYNGFDRAIKRDEFEMGAIYRKISYKMGQASENPTWTAPPQKSPYDVEPSMSIEQRIFHAIGTWSYEDLIPYVQLETAFRSEYEMAQVISGMYLTKDNAMSLSLERLTALACNTYMAMVLNSTNSVCKRDLLTEYNTKFGTKLTRQQALTSSDWLKYASQQINLTVKNMRSFSTVYNIGGFQRHTPMDRVVVEVNAYFASALTSYLQADTYHDELVRLPFYEEIPYWQGTQDFQFESTSSINITNGDVTVSQSGILAFIHDYDAVASSLYKRREYSEFNPRSEVFIVMDKAKKAMIADTTENGVVFYMGPDPADPEVANIDVKDTMKEV